jgi:hypothetical protein
MGVTQPGRTMRMVISNRIRRHQSDRSRDCHCPAGMSVTGSFNHVLIGADRLRDAERILEFMRAGGGVLVHR